MARICENLENLVDFLRGIKHEQDLPLPKPNSTVESSSRLGGTSNTNNNNQQQQQQQMLQDAKENSTTTKATDVTADDDDADLFLDEDEDFNAGDMLLNGPLAKKDAPIVTAPPTSQASPSAMKKPSGGTGIKKTTSFTSKSDGGEDQNNNNNSTTTRVEEEFDKSTSKPDDNNNNDLDDNNDDDDDDDDENNNTLNSNKTKKPPPKDEAQHLRDVELLIVRMTPTWASGVSGFLMEQWQERESYLLNKNFGPEAVVLAQQQLDAQREREREKAAAEAKKLKEQHQQHMQHQRDSMPATMNNETTGFNQKRAESPSSPTSVHLVRKKSSRAASPNSNNNDNNIPSSSPFASNVTNTPTTSLAAGRGSSAANAIANSKTNIPSKTTSASDVFGSLGSPSPIVLARKSSLSKKSITTTFSNNPNENEKETTSTLLSSLPTKVMDNHLNVKLEICSIDPRDIMKQICGLEDLHEKRLDALRTRDKMIQKALEQVMERKKREEASALAAAEKRRLKKLQQQMMNDGDVLTMHRSHNMNMAVDPTIANLETAAAAVFVDNNSNNADGLIKNDGTDVVVDPQAWKEVKIPSRPAISKSLLSFLHPMISPWQDVAHPTYLIFRRKTEINNNANNNNNNDQSSFTAMMISNNNSNTLGVTTVLNNFSPPSSNPVSRVASLHSKNVSHNNNNTVNSLLFSSTNTNNNNNSATMSPKQLQYLYNHVIPQKIFKEHQNQLALAENENSQVLAQEENEKQEYLKRIMMFSSTKTGKNTSDNKNISNNNNSETLWSSNSFLSSSLLINFEFVEGVEGVDVPVLEDLLTKICNERKLVVTNCIAKHNASLVSEMNKEKKSMNVNMLSPGSLTMSYHDVAQEEKDQKDSLSAVMKNFSSFSINTTTNSKNQLQHSSKDGGEVDHAKNNSSNNNKGSKQNNKKPSSSASSSSSSSSKKNGEDNKNNNKSRSPTSSSSSSSSEDDDDSDKYDSSSSEGENFDLDELEAENTQKTLMSAIEVLEIAQRHADKDKETSLSNSSMNNNNNDLLLLSASMRKEVHELERQDSSGNNNNVSFSQSGRQLFKGTSMKYPGQRSNLSELKNNLLAKNNNNNNNSRNNQTTKINSGRNSPSQENQSPSQKNISKSRNNIPRPPQNSSSTNNKNNNNGIRQSRFFNSTSTANNNKTFISNNEMNNDENNDATSSLLSEFEMAKQKMRQLQATKQKSLAKLPDEVLLRKQRMMSLGDFMKEVQSGIFDTAARKNKELKKRRRNARQAQNIAMSQSQAAFLKANASGSGDFSNGGDFGESNNNNNIFGKTSHSSSSDDENDDDDDSDDDDDDHDQMDDDDEKLLAILKSQETAAHPLSVKELVKNLFGSADRQEEAMARVTFSDGPLDVMSKEERRRAESAAAARVLGAEQLKLSQEKHKKEVRSLLRLFCQTRRARNAAVFVIQCAWRRLCQFRRIGVMIDGTFYTHEQARQMKKLERLKKLQSRREALVKEKISEIIQRIFRANQARRILRKLQRQANSSLKIANEYAKRKAKRTSVYCTSSSSWGTLGLPIPPPFDKKAVLLAQLESMRRQWLNLCKDKEEEMLQEAINNNNNHNNNNKFQAKNNNAASSSSSSAKKFKNNNHHHNNNNNNNPLFKGTAIKFGSSISAANLNASTMLLANSSITGDALIDMQNQQQQLNQMPCSAGPAASMMLAQVLEKPSTIFPTERVQLLTTTNSPAASVVAQKHMQKMMTRSVAEYETMITLMNQSIAGAAAASSITGIPQLARGSNNQNSINNNYSSTTTNPPQSRQFRTVQFCVEDEDSGLNAQASMTDVPIFTTFAPDELSTISTATPLMNTRKLSSTAGKSLTSQESINNPENDNNNNAKFASSVTGFDKSITSAAFMAAPRNPTGYDPSAYLIKIPVPFFPPQFPGSKISAFGIVATALHFKEQILLKNFTTQANLQQNRKDRLFSTSTTNSYNNNNNHNALPVASGRAQSPTAPTARRNTTTAMINNAQSLLSVGYGLQNANNPLLSGSTSFSGPSSLLLFNREESNVHGDSPKNNNDNEKPRSKSIFTTLGISKDKVPQIEILSSIELLLPRAAFAPEATWLEVRAVLLSRMNEEEYRIVTQKCLNPK